MKAQRKGDKYVVRSHISDKAQKRVKDQLAKCIKEIQHPKSEQDQRKQTFRYNSIVIGMHNYYRVATCVNLDFSPIAYAIGKQMKNRLGKQGLSKQGKLEKGYIKSKYGNSSQIRFLKGHPLTAYLYKRTIELYIEPHLGHIRLDALNAHTVQHFYNELAKPSKPDVAPLSAKSIKNIHGVLHKALQQAVLLNYIRYNPTTACILPKIVKKEIHPLTDQQTAQLLNLLKGSKYEIPLTVDLFTGLREGELLGLMWDCVDFEKGTILINKQLRRSQRKGGTYYFSPPKNNKSRTITPAPYVMKLLQAQKVQQAEQRLMAGPAWEDSGLVFTNEFGRYVSYRAIFDSYKRIVKRIGLPDARIHDLRHTYAVNCIRAGDDIKTVQSNLGHATAAFTLDVYGHFTDDMRSVSAQRMEGFITNVLNL